MSDNILVTGATGVLGGEIVRQLLAKGLPVKAAARDPVKAESTGLEATEIVLFDYDKPETFEAALSGVDRLFVCPPPLSPRWHELIEPLMETAARSGTRHIVNLSAIVVEHNETMPLRRAEKIVESSGIAHTLLRPNWFMQTFNGFLLESIREQGGIHVPADVAKISFIDMRDIAAVAVAVLTNDKHINRTYELTGGQALDHYEVASLLADVTGNDIRYFPISDEDLRRTLRAAGSTDESIEMAINLYQLSRQGHTEQISPDVANILGREAITFAQYAHDHADSWK